MITRTQPTEAVANSVLSVYVYIHTSEAWTKITIKKREPQLYTTPLVISIHHFVQVLRVVLAGRRGGQRKGKRKKNNERIKGQRSNCAVPQSIAKKKRKKRY